MTSFPLPMQARTTAGAGTLPTEATAPWEMTEYCGTALNLVQATHPLRRSLPAIFARVWKTGAQTGLGFMSTATRLPGSALFLTDIDQVRYQSGVRGVGSSIPEVAAFLRGVIDDKGFDRIVMIGNSAGGYAALLFGALVGADVVHAFSPQTELVNPKYGYFLPKLEAARGACQDEALLDLRRALTERLPDTRRLDPALYVHDSRYCRKDVHHAHRMAGIPGVRLVPYHNVTHGLASALRDAGLLTPLLTSSLNGSSYDVEGIAARARGLWWQELTKHLASRLPF